MPESPEKLLNELRASVALMRLIESGERLVGRRDGCTAWGRAHAAACEVLDRCEAAGIPETELLAILNEGAETIERGA